MISLLNEIRRIDELDLDNAKPLYDWDNSDPKSFKKEVEDMLDTKIFIKITDTNELLKRRNYKFFYDNIVFSYYSKKRNEIYICLPEKYSFKYHLTTVLANMLIRHKTLKVGVNY